MELSTPNGRFERQNNSTPTNKQRFVTFHHPLGDRQEAQTERNDQERTHPVGRSSGGALGIRLQQTHVVQVIGWMGCVLGNACSVTP